MPAKLDLTGRVFVQLTVLQRAPTPSWAPKKTWWQCRCTCGNTIAVRGANLVSGNTKSCGCRRADVIRQRLTKHGACGTREYITWCHIIDRCENPNALGFKHWGGRGIRLCEAWRHDFAAFLRDVGPRPSRRHSIERIDNDGHYEPGNVRWATKRDQANNSRNNHRLTWNGRTLTIMQWSRHLHFSGRAISDRLRRGWSIHRALSTPQRL